MDSSDDEKVQADSPSPSPDLSQLGSAKPSAKVSCLPCRAAKRKCQTLGEDSVCKRCTSHRLDCKYKKHNRGRKRKNPDEVDAARTLALDLGSGSTSSGGPSTSAGAGGLGLREDEHKPFSDPLYSTNTGHVNTGFDDSINVGTSSRHRTSMSLVNPQSQSFAPAQGQMHPRSHSISQSKAPPPLPASSSQQPQGQAPPFAPTRSAASRVDIQFSHVVPIEGDSSPYMSGTGKLPPSATTDTSPGGLSAFNRVLRQDCPDPITAGLLQEGDAFELFKYYFDHLNVTVAILDPVVHTATSCRERSSLLFTSILTVTAKVIRPKQYTSCLMLANKLLGQAVEFGLCSLEIVQAILLLTHWKKADDGTSWRRVGYAIRMAQELRLNVRGPRPLPRNERKAREVLNHERAWSNLIIADYHLAIHHSLPRMIGEELDDPAEWATEHPQISCPGESTLAPWITFSRMCRLYADALAGMNGNPANLRVLAMIEAEWKRWRSKWLEKNDEFNFRSEQISTIRLCDAFYLFHISEYRLLFHARYRNEGGLEPTPLAFAFTECIDAALGVATVFQDGFVQPALLPFCFNLVWVALAVTSVWLVKNIVSMTPVDRERVIRSLSAIRSSTEDASRSSDDMPAYMHRLAKHLLSGISPEWQISSLVSPLQSTAGNAGALGTNGPNNTSNNANTNLNTSGNVTAPSSAANTNHHDTGSSTSTQASTGPHYFGGMDTTSLQNWMMPSAQEIIQDQLWNQAPNNMLDVSQSFSMNLGDVFGQTMHQTHQNQNQNHSQQLMQQQQTQMQPQMNDILFPVGDDDMWKILFPTNLSTM